MCYFVNVLIKYNKFDEKANALMSFKKEKWKNFVATQIKFI